VNDNAAACGWCGAALPGDNPGRRYCSRTHQRKARRARRQGRPLNAPSDWRAAYPAGTR